MGELVQFGTDKEIAVITINNPPVNAISPGVPEGLAAAIQRVDEDPALKAAVVIGAGRTFISGADLNVFVKITSGRARIPNDLPLLRSIEDCRKPVVMAIHGAALGGGLEFAMAGHYRVAAANAQLGQPEVKLGIIPGAAGTQRLPRLVGIGQALAMCVEGNPIKAPEALKLGLIDRIIEGDLLSGAVAFAREIAGRPALATRERNEKLGSAEANAALFAAAREKARKQRLTAPLLAIDAIEAATKLSFEKGCELERKLFATCLYSAESKALVHVFFAERQAAKIPDLPSATLPIPVETAGVIGAGMMGGGIATVFANAGIPVLVKDADQAALDRGMEAIRKYYANAVKRGRFTQEFVNTRMKLITPTLTYDGFANVDIVVEAVFENLLVKRQVFADLDRVCKPGAILASNTSTLSIDAIAAATARPDAVIGTHFFSPANVMRLIEIVPGMTTSKEVIATCMNLFKKLGKISVLVGNCRGFVGNRMIDQYRREAQFLVLEGASVEQVDEALVAFGMAMGPLAMGDLVGLDVLYHGRSDIREKEGQSLFPEDRLYALERYGRKAGLGWYKYDEHRRAIPDPELIPILRSWAAEGGIVQHQPSSEEIIERCIYALVNEGARILEEGHASRAGDIDIILINGYGFPAFRGGAMWYADTLGLEKVYQRTCEFQQQFGNRWQPAPLLERLAKTGKSFADYCQKRSAAV
jgi:3-hydroxyacyl-CoA dehydrogenase